MIKELSQLTDLGAFFENKSLKQAQDRSVEMTVNKLPSWVKHVLKNSPGYQVSTFSCQVICFECETIRSSFDTSFRRCRVSLKTDNKKDDEQLELVESRI